MGKKRWTVPVILHLFLPFWIHSLPCNIHRSLRQNYSTWYLLPYGVLLVSTNRRHYQEKKSRRTKLFSTDFCYISVSSLPTDDFDSGYVPHCVFTTVMQPISHSYSYHWVLIQPLSILIPSGVKVVMAFHCSGPLNASLYPFAVF